MAQEQRRPPRPGIEPETRELDPMQRPDDLPQLDEERQTAQQEPEPVPGASAQSRPGADASPPIGSEVEPTTEEVREPRLTERDIPPAP